MKHSTFVLFGSTGSLAKEKIIPAIYSLRSKGRLKNIDIVLYARREFDTDLHFIKGELNDISKIVDFSQKQNSKKIYFFLALPPNLYPEIIKSIATIEEDIEKIIALEKPFGTSLKNAKELAHQIESIPNTKIYLIDHYLAKEPVINLVKMDINKIKNIKIAILETADVSQRGELFDSLGMIKDVGQNHMLNLLSKIIGSLDKVHYKKGSLKLDQYKGYLGTPGVKENSKTETYFKTNFVVEGTDINIEFEAGKAQKENSVFIKVEYTDGTEYEAQIKPLEKPTTKEAHEYIIEDILNGRERFAVSVNESLVNWKITEEILQDESKAIQA